MFDPYVKQGGLVVIGVVQEQHADRARLYKQWRQLDWPIFLDTLNVLGHKAVPIPVGLNVNGMVVYEKLRNEADLKVLLNKDFRKLKHTKQAPQNTHAADKHFHAGDFDKAIAAYGKGTDAPALFKLGCALRARAESDARKPGDGQAAVEAWGKALALNPNQYIWRRRIQQYGPRLAKPYNFYSWVEQARADIRARGEEPVPLREEPRGAELIDKRGETAGEPQDLDPDGKINRDTGLVAVDTIVTPAVVRAGDRVRVRLVLRPKGGLWNNEAGKLTLSVGSTKQLALKEGTFAHPLANEAESKETRYLEFELEVAADATKGTHPFDGYALFYVCEKKGGTCLYLRRDFRVAVKVDPAAPRIQK